MKVLSSWEHNTISNACGARIVPQHLPMLPFPPSLPPLPSPAAPCAGHPPRQPGGAEGSRTGQDRTGEERTGQEGRGGRQAGRPAVHSPAQPSPARSRDAGARGGAAGGRLGARPLAGASSAAAMAEVAGGRGWDGSPPGGGWSPPGKWLGASRAGMGGGEPPGRGPGGLRWRRAQSAAPPRPGAAWPRERGGKVPGPGCGSFLWRRDGGLGPPRPLAPLSARPREGCGELASVAVPPLPPVSVKLEAPPKHTHTEGCPPCGAACMAEGKGRVTGVRQGRNLGGYLEVLGLLGCLNGCGGTRQRSGCLQLGACSAGAEPSLCTSLFWGGGLLCDPFHVVVSEMP